LRARLQDQLKDVGFPASTQPTAMGAPTELKALHHRALAVMLEVGEILGFHLTEIVLARSYLQLTDKQ